MFSFFFLDRILGRERVFFLFLLIAFLVESVFFLVSYFLVFFYKFPPLKTWQLRNDAAGATWPSEYVRELGKRSVKEGLRILSYVSVCTYCARNG